LGGSAPILIARNLTLTGGTFQAPSNVLSLSGSFLRTGGTFSANSGIVTLAGPAGRTLSAPSTTFNRLDLESTNETGLIGYWKLNDIVMRSTPETFGSQAPTEQHATIRDYSGNGWDGDTARGSYTPSTNWPTHSTDTPPTSLANGGSLSFMGTRSWVEVSPNFSIGSTATIAFWVKIPAANLATQQVLMSDYVGGNWLFVTNSGNGG
jgi:hypothetical protein